MQSLEKSEGVVDINLPPVLVIVGPTASGKTALAIQMAKKYDGEIISADSRAIYKYVDIASAKPTMDEQAGIKHWGIDLVGPADFEKMLQENGSDDGPAIDPLTVPFTVADFKIYAEQKIRDIVKRGKLPIVVGGSGLYIDALIYNYDFAKASKGAQTDEKKEFFKNRNLYHQMTVAELQDYCKNNNIKLPSNFNNKRYLIGAIEKSGGIDSLAQNKRAIKPPYVVVGITTEKEKLDNKIVQRIDWMLANGVVDEYKNISKVYHKNNEVFRTNAYIVIQKYLNDRLDEKDLKDELVRLDKKLVKKQRTWFKRNEQIIWTELDKAPKIIEQILMTKKSHKTV